MNERKNRGIVYERKASLSYKRKIRLLTEGLLVHNHVSKSLSIPIIT
jgi:hypothetical protein